MSSSSQTKTTVPFAHTAAGHAGISTSADGNLLIKPCTPAEITFYEAARHHSNFQAHMPVYMGSLTLNDSPEEQVAATLLRNAQTRRDSKGAEDSSSVTTAAVTTNPKDNNDTNTNTSIAGHIVTDPSIESTPTKQWTPSGGAKLTSNHSIVLSNATSGFQKPNIIDLKLGARLWNDDAPTAKRAKLDEVANSSTSSSLGFRVAGMKVYISDDETRAEVKREVNTTVGNGYKTYDKMYGRANMAADGSNITSAFDEFLWSLNLSPQGENEGTTTARISARRTLLIQRILREIESIQFVLENEESRMYSASILIVYEGDPDALNTVLTYDSPSHSSSTASDTKTETNTDTNNITARPKPGVDPLYTSSSIDNPPDQDTDIQDVEEDEMDAIDIDEDDDDEPKQKIHEVVLIDFAHAKFVPGEGPDENALKGVRSIRRILEGLLG